MMRVSEWARHIVIPDTQVKPGVPTNHLEAAGNFALEWAVKTMEAGHPCRVVHLGDHWDMPSVSSYNRAKEQEGLRIQDDLDAGKEAMLRFMLPFKKYQKRQRKWKERIHWPEFHFLAGNHEERLLRYVGDNPKLCGAFGYHSFGIEEMGWQLYPYRQLVKLDGVAYSHNFYNLKTGRNYSGMMETRLKNIGFSFTQGHEQGFKYGRRVLNDGAVHIGVVAGSFYQHQEEYLGPQGMEDWHGVLVKHRVKDGVYSMMEVTMDFLLEQYV